MNRTRIPQLFLICLLAVGTFPGQLWAGERLPADSPFVQESVLAGSAAVGARLARQPAGDVVAATGQIGGLQPRQNSTQTPGQSPGHATVADGSVDGFVAHSFDNPALEISLPTEWVVERDTAQGLFALTIPGEFAFSFFDSFGDDSFPGLLGLAMFQNQAATLVEQIDESVVARTVDIFFTEQGYPVLRIVFGGDMDGLDVTGVFYLLTGSADIYVLMMITSDRVWSDVADTLDIVTRHIHFDSPKGSPALIQAGDTPLAYTTSNGGVTLELPPRWLLQESSDEDIAFVVADEELSLAAALAAMSSAEIGSAELLALRSLLADVEGTIDEATLAALIDEVFTAMDMQMDSDEFVLEQDLTLIYPGTNPTVRFGGTGYFDDFVMPVYFFVNLREDSLGLAVVLGGAEQAEAQLELIVGLTETIQLPSE
ncbi:MAG: hypothetical protein KF753_07195 [Caldilineaceae bacterium]|nr:hypothetical protein [Caldilineaceae bacterium]